MAVSIHGNASAGGATGAARHGFTLVELLVVIAVLTLLAAILIPVVGAVRLAAQKTDTAALIQALSGAIDKYYQNFHAYPGPLDDQQMYTGQLPTGIDVSRGRPTMSENLFLGIVGGLSVNASGVVSYDPNPNSPARTNPRIGDLANPGRSFEPILREWAADASTGFVMANGMPGAPDTNIPEFLDRFSDQRMPILYLRARQGASGVMSDVGMVGANNQPALYQYDLRQIKAYTTGMIAGPKRGLMMVSRNSADQQYANNWEKMIKALSPQGDPQRDPLIFADYYLKSPTDPGLGNPRGNPRMKDKYILISAGADRIYGTADDITNFGSVSY